MTTDNLEACLSPHELMKSGGKWLAAARGYLQQNVVGGDSCTWGSHDHLPITVKQIEELAAHAACAALNTRSTPKGTVITEDESTWPADGQVVFYKTRDSIPGAMVWIGVDYERFIDCIWWPADQFEPPTDKAGE